MLDSVAARTIFSLFGLTVWWADNDRPAQAGRKKGRLVGRENRQDLYGKREPEMKKLVLTGIAAAAVAATAGADITGAVTYNY
ncbi:MAG: hypothetical protein GY885_13705, partial [Phycisphaeraceae bacterium]|nr:hypothetical protein [Phycisphaeraceae bacterium]